MSVESRRALEVVEVRLDQAQSNLLVAGVTLNHHVLDPSLLSRIKDLRDGINAIRAEILAKLNE